jgi:hypothetical protein
MMSGEISNIFDNLRENSSELKSHWSKAQFQFSLWAERTGECSQTSSWQEQLREPAWARWPILSRKAWAQTPWTYSHQSCPRGKGNIHCHKGQHTNVEKGQRHWESPCQKCQHLYLKSEESSELSANWFFFFI